MADRSTHSARSARRSTPRRPSPAPSRPEPRPKSQPKAKPKAKSGPEPKAEPPTKPRARPQPEPAAPPAPQLEAEAQPPTPARPAPQPEPQPQPQPPAQPPGQANAGFPGPGVRHTASLLRATALDLAILAGHLILYPTGVLPEHPPEPLPPTASRSPRPVDLSGPSNPSSPIRIEPATLPNGRPAPTPAPTDPADPAAPDPGPAPANPCDAADDQDAPRPPVLLLHGFVDNRSAFALLRRSLRRHGWTDVAAVNYSPLTPDLRSAAEQLAEHVENACARSGRPRVDIVAHSLGGLIARYYAQCLGGDARVRTLVTLGTPHAGTRAVPSFTPHPLARQMRPGSSVLTELAGPARGCRTRFVAFWSDLDQLVIPVGSARLEHPDLSATNVEVRGIGHIALPVHGAVAAEIRRALGPQGGGEGSERGPGTDGDHREPPRITDT